MGTAFKFNVDESGIANLVFDLPGEKVNKLSMPVLEELEKTLDDLAKDPNIKALVFSSGKEDIFIAGADLNSFQPMFDHPDVAENMIKTGHRVFNKLQDLPFPSIALINGACLGGGMELALACTHRIATDNPKTQLGLPEVTLGIFPGWGGTQRMPRLVGLIEGLPLILSGKPVDAKKAWKIRLVDAIVSPEFSKERTNEFVKKWMTLEGKAEVLKRRQKGSLKSWLLEKNPIGRAFLFQQAEKDLLNKTKGHYPAPVVALKLIKDTYALPLQDGLNKEIETICSNLGTTFINAKNLLHLFFVQEALKKETWGLQDVKLLPIHKTAIVGAGTMGSGIAWLLSYNNYPVRFRDIDWTAVGKGYAAINSIYSQLLKIRKIKPNEVSLKFHHVSGTTDYSGFQDADIVFEAAVENLDLKHKIFKEAEEKIRSDALIASNTSSLTVAEMSQGMSHPERFLAMHFFNPVNRMPLVEVAGGETTTREAIATAVELSRKLGKTPIVVKDCPGFLVNRIFVMGANETLWLYQEGASFASIEKMMLDFGMPMSPFALSDEVGNDVAYKVSKMFEKAYGDRMAAPKILEIMNEHKFYGKKAGKGFYLYSGRDKKPNHEAEALLKKINRGAEVNIPETEMCDRVILTMVNEAARCLQEKVIENPSYLDMAMIMGTGFPPFRGGLLKYADELGIPYVVSQLKKFQEQVGPRFTPCELLLEMEKSNKKFFP